MGAIKGVGRIYQQTFIDTYAKVANVKLYDRKNALIAADMLNDRVLPWYEEQGVRLLRILTDRGRYCFGKTPLQTFKDSIQLADKKMLDQLASSEAVGQ